MTHPFIQAVLAALLFSLVSPSHGEQFKQAQFKRQHIKSMSVVAPVWEDYTNKDGSGLYWDILRAIYEPEGIKVKVKNVPWNRAMKMVSKYRTYSAIVGEYKDTEENVIFPNYPIDVEYLSVVGRADKGNEFVDYSSLTGKRVGWIKDYELITKDKRDFTLKEFRSIEQGMDLLKADKLDFVIDEWDEVAKAMLEQNMTVDEYPMNDMPEGTDVYVAFSVDNLSRTLIEIYNERVEDLVASGEMAKIYQKWDLGEMPDTLLQLSH